MKAQLGYASTFRRQWRGGADRPHVAARRRQTRLRTAMMFCTVTKLPVRLRPTPRLHCQYQYQYQYPYQYQYQYQLENPNASTEKPYCQYTKPHCQPFQ
eukprot:COSAG03_NODE_16375_length_403_cov_5.351974_1_plen_98_part_10